MPHRFLFSLLSSFSFSFFPFLLFGFFAASPETLDKAYFKRLAFNLQALFAAGQQRQTNNYKRIAFRPKLANIIKIRLPTRAKIATMTASTEKEKRKMIYTDNKQLKTAFRLALKKYNISMTQAAAAAGLIPQELNNRFARKNISLNELQRIASASGFSIDIEFIRATDAPGLASLPGSQGNESTI